MPYKKSLFQRLILYHLAISLLTIMIFGFTWYKSTSIWLLDQNVSYNKQQLDALYKEMHAQHLALKQAQFRLYTFQLEDSNSMYSFLASYLNAIKHYASPDLGSFLPGTRMLSRYLSSEFLSSGITMDMLLLTGLSYSNNDIYKTNSNGNSYPDNYANIICEKIYQSSAIPSRRSTYTIPTFEIKTQNRMLKTYVLYDMIRDQDSTINQIGYIINTYSTRCLDDVLASFLDPLVGTAYVLDNSGNILYDSSDVLTGKAYAGFDMVSTHQNQIFNRDNVKTTVLYDNSFNFYVVGELDRKSINSLGIENYGIIIEVAILVCIVSMLFSSVLVRSTVKRISVLLSSIYQARSNIRVRAPLYGNNDELDAISSGLNNMLERIEDHIQESYIQEIEQQESLLRQRDAELYALQSQVNPHFLYNTLEIIRMKALSNHDEDAAMMIKSLASTFRERIKGSTVILLKQEMDLCRQLMEIFNVRYNSTIELIEDLGPSLLSCAVLRDLLTPIIENVMVHGYHDSMDPEDLKIQIHGHREDDDLILRVSDNGIGFADDQFDRISTALQRPVYQNNHNIGLMNIHSRIRLVYGDPYGLSIISNPSAPGAVVEIRIRVLTTEALNELVTKRL